jgi:hypothetical protein
MIKADKRWFAAGAGVVLVVTGMLVVRHYGKAGKGAAVADGDGAGARRWRGFAAGMPGVQGSAGQPAGGAAGAEAAQSPAAIAEQVKTAMESWRTAILVKDADTVTTLDRAFGDNPVRFGDALVKSAESDENERVRAFSTRVLGKMKVPELAEVFSKLLEDKSPYVRQNAAWALGELGTRPDGREAAQRAAAELRRLEQHDAAKDVRVAANTALKRLQ